MNIIIKSGEKNWSGKEFSGNPAKIYSSFDDAVSALNSYHFFTFNNEKGIEKKQKIEIIHLTEGNERKLLSAGRIRWPSNIKIMNNHATIINISAPVVPLLSEEERNALHLLSQIFVQKIVYDEKSHRIHPDQHEGSEQLLAIRSGEIHS